MKQVLLGLGVAACVFGFVGAAFAAGQGGIAGSASFQLAGAPAAVTSASAAVSVGKSTAYAGAETAIGGVTKGFAAGTGGLMTLTGTNIYIATINGETAVTLAAPQLNSLTGSSTNIAAPAGTVGQTN